MTVNLDQKFSGHKERIRTHYLRCVGCGQENKCKADTHDLPGGVRCGCPNCEEPTAHVATPLHEQEVMLTWCNGHGGWVGNTEKERCPECGTPLKHFMVADLLPGRL
jgi:hypothetical protein